jgi:uncharacterized membrane protein
MVMSSKSPRWLWRRLREFSHQSQWLLPAIGAVGGIALAVIIGSDAVPDTSDWTVSVDRARDTLMSLLGLAFTSLSIVLALISASSQNIVGRYGSRVLRVYLRRSRDRQVIAIFAFTATFMLTEQFQMRTLDPDSQAPAAGIVVSVLLLMLTGVSLIAYISSAVRWFRVDRSAAGVIEAERRLVHHAERVRRSSVPASLPERPDAATDLLASRSGYLAEVDTGKILSICGSTETIVVITAPPNEAVVVHQPIGWAANAGSGISSQVATRIATRIDIADDRVLTEGVDFGIIALVDIAIIALSPAINDPNSAVQVIDEMSFVFAELTDWPVGPYATSDDDSGPRVIVNGRSFGELVELATTQIVLYGITDPNVVKALRKLAASLDLLELSDDDRRYVDEFAAKLVGAPEINLTGPAS